MSTKEAYIVGISGGSGSGKTLLLKTLLEKFDKGQICVISQDNYYLPKAQQPMDQNGVSNFDTPESIDFDAFARDIGALKRGEKVLRKEYTFNNPEAVPTMLTYLPAPVIVVEGIFVFSHTNLSDLLDLKVYIEAKDHIRLKRRIIRDKEERGYDLNDVLYRYERHVVPTFDNYIEPFKHHSDLIIPNNSRFDNALNVLTTFLKSKLPD